MNREIKFRAYLPDGHWAIDTYGQMIEDYTDKVLFESLGFFTDNVVYMQYTGLKDKNGMEIYEGDILDCQDRIVKIVWHNEAGCFDAKFIKYQFNLCSNGCTNQEFKYRAIVIGNIYENPELLK